MAGSVTCVYANYVNSKIVVALLVVITALAAHHHIHGITHEIHPSTRLGSAVHVLQTPVLYSMMHYRKETFHWQVLLVYRHCAVLDSSPVW